MIFFGDPVVEDRRHWEVGRPFLQGGHSMKSAFHQRGLVSLAGLPCHANVYSLAVISPMRLALAWTAPVMPLAG